MSRFARPASGRPAFRGDDRGGGRWTTSAGLRPGLELGAELPAADPQRRELVEASEEKARYFAYLNARLAGQDVKPPPKPRFRAYWPD